MNNLEFGNIAIGAVIVGFLNLLIIILAKTETILKGVEKIKAVVGVDYRNRAKRSADELRISKLHVEVARERVRHTFVTIKKWDCRWVWNWSDSFEPINIKGYCLGNAEGEGLDRTTYKCDQPVYAYYNFPGGEKKAVTMASKVIVGICCTDTCTDIHTPIRVTFEVFRVNTPDSAAEMFDTIISKAILSERDLRIAKEIKNLRWQFWR